MLCGLIGGAVDFLATALASPTSSWGAGKGLPAGLMDSSMFLIFCPLDLLPLMVVQVSQVVELVRVVRALHVFFSLCALVDIPMAWSPAHGGECGPTSQGF